MNKRELGTHKEMDALHYLEKSGYDILERNFYMRGGEADLVATEKDTLCFIEVKYRKDDSFGTALEAVTVSKRKKLIKTARFYLLKHPEYANMNIRFDVIAITGSEISLIKGAFDAV